MPCFRATLFLHLFGMCIISSIVLSVVASPIFHDGALLVSRADNDSDSEASSIAYHPAQDGARWEHNVDGQIYWHENPVEANPNVLRDSGKPNNEVKNLAIVIYQSKGQNTPESKKYWLCVGMRCLRANKDPKAPSDLLSDVIIGRGTLQKSKDCGEISFDDIEHKRQILAVFGKGQRHYFEENSNPTNWDYFAALLRELRRESFGGPQPANQEEIEQYMKEEAKKNLFG
ncbi:MAG: hypothetical protein NXY57DRAFT_1012551 [Lentinula lateritia]|nr:MAG: hypothetical protein NXY57DRAFT_1012551 [Lentinula lateritia]